MVVGQSELSLLAPEVLGEVEWGLRRYNNEGDLANHSDNTRHRAQSTFASCDVRFAPSIGA